MEFLSADDGNDDRDDDDDDNRYWTSDVGEKEWETQKRGERLLANVDNNMKQEFLSIKKNYDEIETGILVSVPNWWWYCFVNYRAGYGISSFLEWNSTILIGYEF